MSEEKFTAPDEAEQLGVSIKGLLDTLGGEKHKQLMEALRKLHYINGMRKLAMMNLIVSRGGNIHNVNPTAVAKRRAANKVAAKQRKVNRDR